MTRIYSDFNNQVDEYKQVTAPSWEMKLPEGAVAKTKTRKRLPSQAHRA